MRGAVAPGGGARAFGLPRWPRLVLLYCAVCPPAVALIWTAFYPMFRNQPLLALGNVVLSLALLCAGLLVTDEPGQRGSAVMLTASSVLLTAGWLNDWKVGPLPLISVPASPAATVLAAWAMFRYQSSPRAQQASNRFFTLMLACVVVGTAFCIAVSVPQWNGFGASAWWPTLVADHALFNTASTVLESVGVVFAVLYMSLWLARWKRSHGISRRLALPVAAAASLVCAAIIVELVADMLHADKYVIRMIYTVETYLQICVPAAFVVSVLQRRFARTRIADLLLRLRGPERVSSITGALRDVLEDPGLEVVDLAPGMPTDNAAYPLPPSGRTGDGRLILPVAASTGEELAVILADPAMSASDDLVRAAVAATSLALENAHLEAELAGQLREVRESRRRIIQAGIAERRRLEHDLHDGIQQGLQGLHVMLSGAEADAADPASRAFIGRIGTELAGVIDELRDLAHGVHPGVLSQVGLAEAVRTMAGRYTVAIDVDLPAGRFGDDAELAAYYVIAEAITNAIKHAQASRIEVQGEKSGGWLRVTVRDDGKGGASADAGTGLRGILDRIGGTGGEAELHSPPGQGTEIRVRIPCG